MNLLKQWNSFPNFLGKLADLPKLSSDEWDVVSLFETTTTRHQGKSVEVPKNWLPFQAYFLEGNFLEAGGLLSRGNQGKGEIQASLPFHT